MVCNIANQIDMKSGYGHTTIPDVSEILNLKSYQYARYFTDRDERRMFRIDKSNHAVVITPAGDLQDGA